MRTGLVLLFAVCLGCAHPISEGLRKSVDPTLTFSQVISSPDAHRGKRVMLGGTIVKTRNLPEGTEIELVQIKIDSWGNPIGRDYSGGRFIFFSPKYLESEIYSEGREVTGAGTVKGSKMGKVGSRDYKFPVIEVEEIHLWEQLPPYPYYPPYWDPFYHPHLLWPHGLHHRLHYPYLY